eukprot:gene9727-11944_t
MYHRYRGYFFNYDSKLMDDVFLSGQVENVKYLIVNSPLLDCLDWKRVIDKAVESRSIEMVRYLMELVRLKGETLKVPTSSVVVATTKNDFDMVRFLVEEVAAKDKEIITPEALQMAAFSQNDEMLLWLIERFQLPILNGFKMFNELAKNGNYKLIQEIRNRQSPIERDSYGNHSQLCLDAVMSDSLECVKYIFEEFKFYGVAPIAWSIEKGKWEIFKYLHEQLMKQNQSQQQNHDSLYVRSLRSLLNITSSLPIVRSVIQLQSLQPRYGPEELAIVVARLSTDYHGNIELFEYVISQMLPELRRVELGPWSNIIFNRGCSLTFETLKYHDIIFQEIDSVNGKNHFRSDLVAKNGNLKLLQFLYQHYSHKIPNTEEYISKSISNASEFGHLEIVEFLFQKLPSPVNSNNDINSALKLGSKNGHLKIIQFLTKQKVNIDISEFIPTVKESIELATQHGHLKIVQFHFEKLSDLEKFIGKDFFVGALTEAVIGGHMDIVEFIQQVKPEIIVEKRAIIDIVRIGNIEMIKYLDQSSMGPLSLDHQSVTNIGISGNMEILKYFESRLFKVWNSNLTTFLLTSAIENGHLEMIHYLVDRYKMIPTLTKPFVDTSIIQKHNHLLEYFYHIDSKFIKELRLDQSHQKLNPDIIKMLRFDPYYLKLNQNEKLLFHLIGISSSSSTKSSTNGDK